MNKSCLQHVTVTVLLLMSLMAGPLVATKTLAQNTSTTTTQTSPAQGSNTAQTTSTRQTTTTTTTQPVQTQTTTVDPLWIAAGVIGLLALLAIVLLAMRGRSTDRVATTRESTTVIKKD
jgi:beta-lactamase regulating signal transducer with metallopeptidase domain